MKRMFAFLPVAALLLAACGGGGETDAAGGPREFCDAAVDSLAVPANNPNRSQAQTQEQLFEQLNDAAPRIAESAPDEIKDEAETFAEELPKLQEIMRSVDYDTTKLNPDQQAELQNEAFTQALQTIVVYMSENCSAIQQSGGQSTPSPAADNSGE